MLHPGEEMMIDFLFVQVWIVYFLSCHSSDLGWTAWLCVDIFCEEAIVFCIRPLLERSYREELNQEEALGNAVGKKLIKKDTSF